MIRLMVKEFVQENAPELTMTRLGIIAQVSQNFMRKIWHDPDNAHLYLDHLDLIAQALTDYLRHEVTVCDLVKASNLPRN